MTERDTKALEARISHLEAELLQLQERDPVPPGVVAMVKVLAALVWLLLLVAGVAVLHWMVGWPP